MIEKLDRYLADVIEVHRLALTRPDWSLTAADRCRREGAVYTCNNLRATARMLRERAGGQ